MYLPSTIILQRSTNLWILHLKKPHSFVMSKHAISPVTSIRIGHELLHGFNIIY